MTTGVRQTGDFCWINVMTSDPVGAREFFSKVLGWTYGDMGGMGDLIQVGGKTMGAMFDINGPNSPPNVRPVVAPMVRVDSADAIVEKANSLGGSAKPAFDIMDNGRMAEPADPTGAKLDVWQPIKQQGAEHDPAHHGGTTWFELLTTDVDKSVEFYKNLFGWTSKVMSMPGMDYTTFAHNGSDIAGAMKIGPEMGPMPSNWGTYFTVDDADAAAKTAEELGAQIFVPPTDIPGIGRFSAMASPQGVMFSVVKYLPR
ncbi:MAG: VOC family protein [Gemmatimonadaceae bacterium]